MDATEIHTKLQLIGLTLGLIGGAIYLRKSPWTALTFKALGGSAMLGGLSLPLGVASIEWGWTKADPATATVFSQNVIKALDWPLPTTPAAAKPPALQLNR